MIWNTCTGIMFVRNQRLWNGLFRVWFYWSASPGVGRNPRMKLCYLPKSTKRLYRSIYHVRKNKRGSAITLKPYAIIVLPWSPYKKEIRYIQWITKSSLKHYTNIWSFLYNFAKWIYLFIPIDLPWHLQYLYTSGSAPSNDLCWDLDCFVLKVFDSTICHSVVCTSTYLESAPADFWAKDKLLWIRHDHVRKAE